LANSGLTSTDSEAQPSELLNRVLLLDLETTRTGRVRHIGALLNSHVFEKKERAGSVGILKQLDKIAENAEFVLGHNLLGHDFQVLKSSSPWLQILKKPVIVTLYLISY
jgi:ATP-dependent DNA helicase RecQ